MQRIEPNLAQESAWDYSRPPRLERSGALIEIVFAGHTLAKTARSWRVLEILHSPVYYVPPEDVDANLLQPGQQTSFCEWKGVAHYFSVYCSSEESDITIQNAAWYYPNPTPEFEAIRNYIAFYLGRVDACFVDGERVRAQSGDFYGGWITSDIVGPFKGGAASGGW